MARIALDHHVRAVASQLGVTLRADPTALIVDRCVQRVAAWADELGPVDSLEGLLDVVCEKLRLRFELLESDEDVGLIRAKYLKARELAFADLDREFNATTDAVVFRLRNAPEWSNVRYVAVVDGRGHKRYRIWFSKWHEVAHLLAEPQTKFVYRRTQAFKREPVERLMDQIAGALAFYEPLFVPQLVEHRLLERVPRLAELASFAQSEHPYASLQATIGAAIKHHRVPLVLVEAKLALKSGEKQGAKPRLRAVTSTHNPAALRKKIFVHRNMRVPERSIIAAVFANQRSAENRSSVECLSWWESAGESLSARPMRVEAMRAGASRVLALCAFLDQ
jgi:hypothetical protein